MRIGIFLAYGPQTHLGQEGLGRYLAGLVKGFSEQGQEVVILTPKWSVENITELFREFNIQDDAVSFSVLERVPVFWGVLKFAKKFRKKKEVKAKKYRILKTGVDLLEKLVGYMIHITNAVFFAALCILLFLLGCILLPFALVGTIVFLFAYLVRSLIKRQHISPKELYRKLRLVTRKLSKTGVSIDEYAYNQFMDRTIVSLVDKANRQDVDLWFIPALFWPETKNLKQTRVITVPDLVTEEFANLCSDNTQFAYSTEKCRETVRTGEFFITYCEHIKKTVLQYEYGKQHVIAIPHPLNDMLTSIEIDKEIEKKLNSSKDFTDAFARIQMRTLPPHAKHFADVYANYSFQNTKYIFYPSQARPYKNLLNLVKAYHELAVKRYCNIKLILTCDFNMCPDVLGYITKNGLQFDVFSFFGVSVQQLASLYRCAELVVTPTLYEGGFPFTFGEGMSVGTPSVMSNIPQVRDVVEEYGLAEEMLFDPYDYHAIADKIEYGLQHKAELYQKQLVLYEDMKKRTTSVVAKEYLCAFETFIKQAKEIKHV